MKFTNRSKNWMAWLIAISMMLSMSPAVFAETTDADVPQIGTETATGEMPQTEQVDEQVKSDGEGGPESEVKEDDPAPVILEDPELEIKPSTDGTRYEIRLVNIAPDAAYRIVRIRVYSAEGNTDDAQEYSFDESVAEADPKAVQSLVREEVLENGALASYTYTANVDIASLKRPGLYKVEASYYQEPKRGSFSVAEKGFVTLAASQFETAVPTGGTVKIASSQYSKGTFTVALTGLKNAQFASKVRFKVWSRADQGDARWYDGALKSGAYTRAVNIANHNYAGTYLAEAYVVDTAGNTRLHGSTSCNMNASASISVKNLGKNNYRVRVSAIKYPGSVKKRKLTVWSNKKGRDDVKTYTLSKGKKGVYTVKFNLKKYKHLGAYTGNLYIYDARGKRHLVSTKAFTVSEPRAGKVSIVSVNVSKGTFTAKMTGLKNASRMKSVRFKVWSNSGNVKWYKAKKKGGTYTASINIKKHGSSRGTYNVYGYTVDTKKDYKLQSKASRSMALPKATTGKKTPVVYASTAAATNKYARQLGIDVSHHQGNINWAKVKADGVKFAIIRTSDSTETLDRQWVNNVKGCAANGIPFGVYIYSRAKNKTKAAQEANLVLSRLSEVKARPAYPIYYDLEDPTDTAPLSKAKLAEITTEFARVIQGAGYTPGVYSSKSWWDSKLTYPVFNQYPKWIAQWPINYMASSQCTYTKGAFKMWQFSDNGRVNGISGAVDLNWMY